jgi:hypothetical protein
MNFVEFVGIDKDIAVFVVGAGLGHANLLMPVLAADTFGLP